MLASVGAVRGPCPHQVGAGGELSEVWKFAVM